MELGKDLCFSCSLCYDSFRGDGSEVPLVLLCGHTMCGECAVRVWITSKDECLRCPFCNFKSFPSLNFALIPLFERRYGGEDGRCEFCDEKEGEFWCSDCAVGFQRQCRECFQVLHSLKKYQFHQKRKIRRFILSSPSEKEPSPPSSPSQSSPSPSPSPSPSSASPSLPSHSSPSQSSPSPPFSLPSSRYLSKPAEVIIHYLNNSHFTQAFLTGKKHFLKDGDCAGLLAMCTLDGHGTPVSHVEAQRLAKHSTELGSLFGRGISFYLEKKYEECLPYLRPYADAGYSVAQRCVGLCYDMARKDFESGVKYYQLGADQGYAPAINNLASCYGYGEGVKVDGVEAFRLFTLSSNLGNAIAQKNLAQRYFDGSVGVQKDELHGAKLCWRATALKLPTSFYYVGRSFVYGRGIRVNTRAGFRCYEKAIDCGEKLPFVLSSMAICYEGGYGVVRDLTTAFLLFLQAMDGGSKYALRRVGEYYLIGRGTPKNIDLAKKYLQQAADGNDSKAKELLGKLSEEGEESEVDGS